MSSFIEMPPAEVRRLRQHLLQHHVPGRSACLDLGTGGGAFLPTLATRFATVYAADRAL
jgi:hypothetical protein